MADIQLPARSWQSKVLPFFTVTGWVLILVAVLIGFVTLTPTAVDYFGDHSKLKRDAAGINLNADPAFEGHQQLIVEADAAGLDTAALRSELLTDVESLQSTPRWLEPLAFVGVAMFMIGIALEFSSIPKLLRTRGNVMRAAYQQIVSA